MSTIKCTFVSTFKMRSKYHVTDPGGNITLNLNALDKFFKQEKVSFLAAAEVIKGHTLVISQVGSMGFNYIIYCSSPFMIY